MTQTTEQLWQAILTLRSAFKTDGVYAADIQLEAMAVHPNEDRSIRIISQKGFAKVSLDTYEVSFSDNGIFSDSLHQRLYTCYLQFLLAPLQAHAFKRAVVIAHCAQTLDGKMATLNDHSQWIGNKHNLVHAHRMRAITDSIMVGARTYEVDKPQLTVRHVEGANPIRLVLSRRQSIDGLNNTARCVGSSDGKLQPVLESLYSMGIYSVFLEGGALTLSAFMEQQLIDVMQIHIAPMLLGSGKQVVLPTVKKVTDSLQFNSGEFIPVGDEIMFIGRPDYTKRHKQQCLPNHTNVGE